MHTCSTWSENVRFGVILSLSFFFSFLHFSTLKLNKCKKLKKKDRTWTKSSLRRKPSDSFIPNALKLYCFFFVLFFFVMFWRCACAFGLSSYFYLLFLWKSLGLRAGRCSRQKRERERETERDRDRQRERAFECRSTFCVTFMNVGRFWIFSWLFISMTFGMIIQWKQNVPTCIPVLSTWNIIVNSSKYLCSHFNK